MEEMTAEEKEPKMRLEPAPLSDVFVREWHDAWQRYFDRLREEQADRRENRSDAEPQ